MDFEVVGIVASLVWVILGGFIFFYALLTLKMMSLKRVRVSLLKPLFYLSFLILPIALIHITMEFYLAFEFLESLYEILLVTYSVFIFAGIYLYKKMISELP